MVMNACNKTMNIQNTTQYGIEKWSSRCN